MAKEIEEQPITLKTGIKEYIDKKNTYLERWEVSNNKKSESYFL